MIVPPRGRIPETCEGPRSSKIGSTSPRQPSRTATTSQPSASARRTTARMTALSPGQSPPPVRIPTLFAIDTEPNHLGPSAEGGNRTHTTRRPPDFESGASTSSATSACGGMVRHGIAQHLALRNKKRCASLRVMAVAIATKVDALRTDFGSAARLADMLGVSRAQVTRWLRGSGIDPLNAEKVDLLELVWSNLLRLYDREAALAWLFGLNPVLGDRRPIDLIREGRTEELMRAIRAERSDSFA